MYGLPEAFRREVSTADLVANPGCYPTAVILGLLPFLREGILPGKITVHALSGVSGAGRSPKQHFHFPEMEGNFFAYSVEKHRHTPEMEEVLKILLGKEVRVRFTPTVVPASRGLIATVYVETDPINLRELFTETFREEPLVKVLDTPPMTRWVIGTSLCLVYPFYDERTSTAVVLSAIDNLGKGASHQAVQNMNLMFGLEEAEGLITASPFP
ncbi:MAG: N-acetyl-gamma-glutamyl-phosphate reductase [Aquificota bacterium]|nr:N-acetyl-gamma-glutamyl-phosphate reductase [Aquificota bacterium]